MDAIFEPMTSTLSRGLTLITMRTERRGIIGGEIKVGVGAAQATRITPAWMGLPHFVEHMITSGASLHYAADEASRYLRDKLYISPNASTDLLQTRYLTNGTVGQVLETNRFWKALEVTFDGIFFPKFDPPTMERERKRTLEEIARDITSSTQDHLRFCTQMFGVDYFSYHPLGHKEKVQDYTQGDCFAFHAATYSLDNICVSLVGDIDHQEAIQKIEALTKKAPAHKVNIPQLEPPKVQSGEFRRVKDGANSGYVEVELFFPAKGLESASAAPTSLAVNALSKLIEDKIKDKFGLYTAFMSYKGSLTKTPQVVLKLISRQKKHVPDFVAFALETMQTPHLGSLIKDTFADLVGKNVANLKTNQSTVEALATLMNNFHTIGVSPLSPANMIKSFKSTTPEEVLKVAQELSSAPMFLNLRGHADALDALPPIDVIDSWRARPQEPTRTTEPLTRATPAAPTSLKP